MKCVLVGVLMATATVSGQSRGLGINLLTNTSADGELRSWWVTGRAVTEEFNGNRVFVLRHGAILQQPIELPDHARYVLFVGHASGPRVDAASGITDRPYLYGLFRNATTRRIVGYAQGETMRSRTGVADAWTLLWGVFEVPAETTGLTFQLGQARHRDVPHDGSAARFDDVGLFAFSTRAEAESFLHRYR